MACATAGSGGESAAKRDTAPMEVVSNEVGGEDKSAKAAELKRQLIECGFHEAAERIAIPEKDPPQAKTASSAHKNYGQAAQHEAACRVKVEAAAKE
eukprot:12065806-Alexandrium_andersonii.AAC.1